jgi:hypothetical protein
MRHSCGQAFSARSFDEAADVSVLRAHRLLGPTHALRQRDKDLLGQRGGLFEQLPEVTAMDDEQPNRRVREHSRRPGFPVQETHFAEEPPGTHALMTLRRHLDPGGTINDEEEMIAGLSRTREDLPGGGLQHRGDPADRAKLAHRAVLQDGYALQIADLLILTDLRSENNPSLARLVRGIGDRAVHHATHMRPTISMTRLLYSIALLRLNLERRDQNPRIGVPPVEDFSGPAL